MAWTNPATGTVAAGEISSPTKWNTFACDNATYLKGETDKLSTVSQAQPANALDTFYQNTSGKIRAITIYTEMPSNAIVYLVAGTTTAIVSTVAGLANISAGTISANLHGIIPPNYYYKATKNAGSPVVSKWTEWDFH